MAARSRNQTRAGVALPAGLGSSPAWGPPRLGVLPGLRSPRLRRPTAAAHTPACALSSGGTARSQAPLALTPAASTALLRCSRDWGRQGRRLRVEFAKNDANVRKREEARRAAAEPNKTLFVAGFDPRTTRSSDVEKAFDGYGRLKVGAGV